MIYATLSCTLFTRPKLLRVQLKLRGVAPSCGYKRVSGPEEGSLEMEGVGEEARDIYRCRVRCEVVPRVTGIRFPGAAGPCRGTGPSFTSRTSSRSNSRAVSRPIATCPLPSVPNDRSLFAALRETPAGSHRSLA